MSRWNTLKIEHLLLFICKTWLFFWNELNQRFQRICFDPMNEKIHRLFHWKSKINKKNEIRSTWICDWRRKVNENENIEWNVFFLLEFLRREQNVFSFEMTINSDIFILFFDRFDRSLMLNRIWTKWKKSMLMNFFSLKIFKWTKFDNWFERRKESKKNIFGVCHWFQLGNSRRNSWRKKNENSNDFLLHHIDQKSVDLEKKKIWSMSFVWDSIELFFFQLLILMDRFHDEQKRKRI